MVEGKNDFPISHRASPGKPLYGDGKRRKKGRRKKGTGAKRCKRCAAWLTKGEEYYILMVRGEKNDYKKNI